MKIQKILLTNDDGIFAEGLKVLANTLVSVGIETMVVVPDRERSATGHGMTMDRPLRISKINEESYGVKCASYICDGLPTDCVIMGVEAIGFVPDMVLSGINNGPNLGDDVTYSGTVCAALEGLVYGIPSMAVSLLCQSKESEFHYKTAASAAAAIIKLLEKYPMSENVMYNMNVPNMPLEKISGIKFTHRGIRRYVDKITVIKDQFGKKAYWIGGKISDTLCEGSDVTESRAGYITVTPIKLDMTDYEAVKKANETNVVQQIEKEMKTISNYI